MTRRRPEAISPTAHYTGTVWLMNDLSHPGFATLQGQALHAGLRLPHLVAHRLGRPSMDNILLARHRLIDLQLERAISSGEITQVIEVAAGLSPRGWRFAERHGRRIRYIEADLPGMAQRKRDLLVNAGLDSEQHTVVDLNALLDDGPGSLQALVAGLDPTQGTALITEGLINYFDTDTVVAMWARFGRALARFPNGLYLSDLHLDSGGATLASRMFMRMLSTFVGGKVHLHFRSQQEALAALRAAGFDAPELLDPRAFADSLPDCRRPGVSLVRIVCARRGG